MGAALDAVAVAAALDAVAAGAVLDAVAVANVAPQVAEMTEVALGAAWVAEVDQQSDFRPL